MNNKITKMVIEGLFNKFNKEYFGERLPTPIIYINQSRKALGLCSYKLNKLNGTVTHTIKISNFYDRPMHDIEQTLIHEMIHLYFHSKGMYHVKHGREFQDMARTFDKYGYDIHTTSKVEKKTNDTIPLRFLVKFHNPTDGMIWLCCLSTSKLAKWVVSMGRRGFKDIEYFKSTSALFGDYKVCQTKLSGKVFSPNAFNTEALPYLVKCDLSELG